MDPAQSMACDLELAGIVAEDDGIGQQAMSSDGAPQRTFGGQPRRVKFVLEFVEAEALEVALPGALIGEMLLSSRLDVAQGIERAEPVDLLALAAEEAAHFDLEVSGDAVILNADSMLLRRLVRNLLENAQIHAGGATSLLVGRSGRHASS